MDAVTGELICTTWNTSYWRGVPVAVVEADADANGQQGLRRQLDSRMPPAIAKGDDLYHLGEDASDVEEVLQAWHPPSLLETKPA